MFLETRLLNRIFFRFETFGDSDVFRFGADFTSEPREFIVVDDVDDIDKDDAEKEVVTVRETSISLWLGVFYFQVGYRSDNPLDLVKND